MTKSPKSFQEHAGGTTDQPGSPSEPENGVVNLASPANAQEMLQPSVFPIVGLVASAGGLEAFKKFFAAMPADSGVAFVLIPHLDPSRESRMVELLSKLTSMPVTEAKQGMVVQVNSLYIIPPSYFLSISNGQLQLSAPPANHGWQTSIDFFLRSLAKDQGERAIGIVLSGTGSHGVLGIREIKQSGGMVMAQQPDTAEYDQMPVNAISTGVIDYILPPEQMPAAIVNYVEQPYLKSSDGVATAELMSDLLNQILEILQSQVKYDFHPYRKPMVLRRIQRRMGIVHIDNMLQYLEFLQKQPDEVTALYNDLLISVTAFFRDPEAYQVLKQEIIPALIAKHDGDRPIRVWVPGCASGEEAYSIAMLLFEAFASIKSPVKIQLFASDIDANAIEVARRGIYPASVISDVSPERMSKFFVMLDENHFQINKQLREAVVFSNQNLIGDAPFSKLDLISCRNLLIYLEPEMQKNVISLFHFALVAGGYLLLGPSETIGRSSRLFETVSKKWRVFRRLDSAKRDLINIPIRKSTEPYSLIESSSSLSTLHRKSFKEITEQLILNDHSPAAALCNSALEVLYVTGPLVNFLEFPRGELTKDLLAMARPGLRTKLRATCRNAIKEGKTIVTSDVRLMRGEQHINCSVTARPISEPKEAAGLLLVLFHEHVASNELDGSTSLSNDSSAIETSVVEEAQFAQQLEIELKSMSEELHSTIEEMESSNEELKTSNEEIMSVNEELQSVNEELETSKEELQSLNEELTTVNGQLQDKVTELKQATDDLTNLMSSTEIATIFLDQNLNIKRFTPPTRSLLNLLSTDLGRPLKDIAPNFADDTMHKECRQVLESEKSLEREVQTEDHKHYLRRILPYRTTDNHIDGVVITFVDLTQRKLSEEIQREKDARHFAELHESAERMQAILNTAADAIVTVDLQGTIDSINLATERLFLYKRDELLGENIALMMPTLFSVDQDRAASSTNAARLAELVGNRREVLAQRRDGSTFPVDLALSKVDHLGLYTGILRDITVRKQLQAHILEIATEEQSRIGQELHDGTQQELTGLSLFAGAIHDFLDNANHIPEQDALEWRLHDIDYQRIKQTLAKLTHGLIEANNHIHKLSHGIMPVQIDAEGLRSALAELASSTNTNQKLNCRFKFAGSGTIRNNSVATQLYRIAQESLNNSLKHGKASDIQISLAQSSEQIILEISDNGIGFDPQESTRARSDGGVGGGGLGLRIMNYRASILGGELYVSRNDRNGTTVRCTIPTTSDLT